MRTLACAGLAAAKVSYPQNTIPHIKYVLTLSLSPRTMEQARKIDGSPFIFMKDYDLSCVTYAEFLGRDYRRIDRWVLIMSISFPLRHPLVDAREHSIALSLVLIAELLSIPPFFLFGPGHHLTDGHSNEQQNAPVELAH